MRNTLRTLKDHKRELIKFANLLGTSDSTWADINQHLIITNDLITNNDKGTAFCIPEAVLDNSLPAYQLKRLFYSLFQPNIRLVTDQIMFSQSFNALLALWQKKGLENVPILSKGASYPSILRDAGTNIMPSENIWLLDLFTRGVEYCRRMNDYGAYIVIDTTYYEGWNKFTEDEFMSIVSNLPKTNPGSAVVERYMTLINKPQYKYILENIRIRGNYLKAIAKTLGLTKTVRIEDIMPTKEYAKFLTQALRTTDSVKLFSKKVDDGDTNHLRDFSAFVYAEELSLRSIMKIDGFTGPLREELPMSVKVLQLYRLTGARPTPTVWYTRPGKFPNLNFSDGEEKTKSIFLNGKYEQLIPFMAENLTRAGLVENKEYGSNDSDEIINSLMKLMKNVEKNYIDLK